MTPCVFLQEAFTRVLMGNIEISRTVFPSGTKGNTGNNNKNNVNLHHYMSSWPPLCPEGRAVYPEDVCVLVAHRRSEHGDAGSPGPVGGGPELRTRDRTRHRKLLWRSRVYVAPCLSSLDLLGRMNAIKTRFGVVICRKCDNTGNKN